MALTDEDKIWLAGRFDRIDARFDGIDARLDGIDARLDGIDARFAAIDARLDGIDARLDGIDARLDGIDARFAAIDTRLDRMDVRFDAIDDRSIATNDRIDKLTSYVLDMRTEVVQRFNSLDQRVDFIVSSVPNSQPLTKAMFDLGTLMGQLTRSQQQSTDRHYDLAARIAQLEDQVSKLIKPAA